MYNPRRNSPSRIVAGGMYPPVQYGGVGRRKEAHMKWVLLIAGIIVALIVAVAGIGATLPKKHKATRAARFHQPPEAVWQAITDIGAFPAWRTDVKSVERLPDRDGRPAWRETDKHGQILTLEAIEFAPPQRLVSRIADPNLPFGGAWTYLIAPADGGSTLRITEDGEIYNPIFRFMARFVFGYQGTMDAYLKALGGKFGESVQLED